MPVGVEAGAARAEGAAGDAAVMFAAEEASATGSPACLAKGGVAGRQAASTSAATTDAREKERGAQATASQTRPTAPTRAFMTTSRQVTLHRGERLVQIGNDVCCLFDPNRKPNQSVADANPPPLRRGKGPM